MFCRRTLLKEFFVLLHCDIINIHSISFSCSSRRVSTGKKQLLVAKEKPEQQSLLLSRDCSNCLLDIAHITGVHIESRSPNNRLVKNSNLQFAKNINISINLELKVTDD